MVCGVWCVVYGVYGVLVLDRPSMVYGTREGGNTMGTWGKDENDTVMMMTMRRDQR